MNSETNFGFGKGDWAWLLLFSVLLLIVGGYALANPLPTALAAGIFLSISLLMIGTMSFFMGVFAKGIPGRWADILFGILAFIAGILAIQAPLAGALSLVWATGAMFVAAGGMELYQAFQSKEGRGWLVFLGIVDVGFGLWIMFGMPGAVAIMTLAFMVGLGFIFRGVMLAIASFSLRKLTH